MGKKKSKSGLFITLGVILALVAVVIFININKNKDAIKVQTTKVTRQTIKQIVTATGHVQPETEVKVSSETSGEIVYLGVQEGDTVRKNQILVRIKPDIIATQLEQAAAGVEASDKQIDIYKTDVQRLKKDFVRMKELLAKQFVSQQEYDAADAQYQSAISNLAAAESRYKQSVASYKLVQRDEDRTVIFAPIDGIITKLNVELGEKVVGTGMMAGTELMIVADMNIINAEVSVDENDIILVSIGDTTAVEIDAFPDMKFKGTVFEIGHSAQSSELGTQDQVTNFLVKIRLHETEARIRPGMSCNADIETEVKYKVLSIPLQAVTVRDTKGIDKTPDIDENSKDFGAGKIEDDKDNKKVKPKTVVFVYEDGKAKKVAIETGVSDKGNIEVINGVKEGAMIISGPFSAVNKELQGGEAVEVDTNFYKFKKK